MARPPRLITANGKTQTLTEWAHELGLTVTVLFQRIARGWSVEDAINRPLTEPHAPHDWTTRKDITGKRFGKFTVLRHAGRDAERKAMWLCRCDCGKEAVIQGKRLRAGTSASCGCSRLGPNTHGATCGGKRTPEFWCWIAMQTRCTNPRQSHWHRYGGRGIRVCDQWLGRDGFANFLSDMGPRPSKGYTIDRYPNADGNYEPNNCRWATQKQQANNRGTPTHLLPPSRFCA